MLRARAAGKDVTASRVPPAPSRLQARNHQSSTHSDIGNQAMLRRLSRTSPHLQRKLTVGAVNDPLEAEADRVADQVMRMPEPDAAVSSGSPQIIRKCAACEEEDKKAHAKPNGAAALPGEAPPIVHDVLSSSGQPLDAETRAYFEPRFGVDFSGVRVHDGGTPAKSASSMNAMAYAVGNHIVFAQGQFAPRTPMGGKLLAHELTHVVQQNAGGVNPSRGEQGAPATVNRSVNPLAISRAEGLVVSRFAGPPVPVTPAQVEAMRALFQQVNALRTAGALTAEEAVAIPAAVAEAEAAVVAAGEVAAAGATAVAVGEGALATSAGLAADDVTGIGVADDVAIPFVLLAAAVAFGVGYAVGSSAAEIVAAWDRARAAMARAVQLMRDALARHPAPPVNPPVPVPRQDTDPRQDTQTETRTQPRPNPRTRPDIDTDEEDRQCRGMATGQRGGNSCHDQFATSISGTSREWGVETPEGLYADFDALGAGRMLFEVKTGYGFLLNTSESTRPLRQSTINRFIDQASLQTLIATRCGYSLRWVFNTKAVADLVQGYIEPPVSSIPFTCNEDR